jgi:hypothetical protein
VLGEDGSSGFACRVRPPVAGLIAGPPGLVAAAAPPSPQEEVLAVVNLMLDGWREANSGKVDSALHKDLRLVTLRESPAETQTDTRERMIELVKKIKPGSWDDRLHNPEVRVDPSGIATVWAKYEFYSAGKRSHCGILPLQLYRVANAWKIVNFADTHSEGHCP